MDFYLVYQKINDLAKQHGLKTIEEEFECVKLPNMLFPETQDTPDPIRAKKLLEEKIKLKGFRYFFEADEDMKPVLARQLVIRAAQIKKIIQS